MHEGLVNADGFVAPYKRYDTKCTDWYLNFNMKNDVDTHMVNMHDKKIPRSYILEIVIIVIKISTQKYSWDSHGKSIWRIDITNRFLAVITAL